MSTYPYFLSKKDPVTTTTVSNVTSFVIHVKAEMALNDHFGIALCFNRSTIDYSYAYYYFQSYSATHVLVKENVHAKITTINLRLNYHFFPGETLDPYIGIGAGIRTLYTTSADKEDLINPKIPFGFELTAGLRYLVRSRIGIYSEVGLGRSLYQIGLSVNIGRLKYGFRKSLL